MTNSQYTQLLQMTARLYNRYHEKLEIAHAEYLARYGVAPGDIDDDFWIDSLEGGGGKCDDNITAEDVEANVVAIKERKGI